MRLSSLPPLCFSHNVLRASARSHPAWISCFALVWAGARHRHVLSYGSNFELLLDGGVVGDGDDLKSRFLRRIAGRATLLRSMLRQASMIQGRRC
jgi:hypothetical protein